jgi:NAD(P)H dehydrogenase (quinone)
MFSPENSWQERVLLRIAVIYFSATGTTARLAGAIQSGAAEFAHVDLCRIAGDDIVSGRFQNEEIMKIADAAAGLAFGSPTLMGGPAAQFKAFADATSDRWSEQRWATKVATGFTTGSCANGDQSYTLAYFTVLAAQHGMLWCSLDIPGGADPDGRNRLGSQIGLVTQPVDGVLADADLATAHYLGRRLARVARVGRPP